MKKQVLFFYYLLGIYVILQFSWWGYHLIQLTKEISTSQQIVNKRIGMILGEGMVFLLILVVGLWKIKRSIQKEHELAQRQNNFLLSVTHELKTPIASIKLYIQTLLKRNLEKDKQTELLQKALIENERLDEIVEALLISARLENRQISLHKENILLNDLLIELKEKYDKKLNKNWINLKIEQEVNIHNDPFLLKTILINLIENALKYAGSENPIFIETNEFENKVQIKIKDLGVGIPENFQEKMFEKFVRLENEETRSNKGAGLGLFIVKEFTKICQGTISYENNQTSGSVFILTLIKKA
jgi:two-component system, OmpR family, phosphate regulon sensor histidine kinase PhoR